MSPARPEPKGLLLNLQRFSLHDGPGIRTTVFLKGCPLRCSWCHNPQAIVPRVEVAFLPDRCVSCGACVEACPQHAHRLVDGLHQFDRDRCHTSADCVNVCPSDALHLEGRLASVDEVMTDILKDKPYYARSGGGVTLSGGEPLFQSHFCAALLEACGRAGIHRCVETSGFASRDQLDAVISQVDLLLFDIKLLDDARHIEWTGVSNQRILENLRALDERGTPIILRCPIIPGVNAQSTHLAAIAELANSLSSVLAINLLPYHPYGSDRHLWFGRPNPLPDTPTPTAEQVSGWESELAQSTRVPVLKS